MQNSNVTGCISSRVSTAACHLSKPFHVPNQQKLADDFFYEILPLQLVEHSTLHGKAWPQVWQLQMYIQMAKIFLASNVMKLHAVGGTYRCIPTWQGFISNFDFKRSKQI